MKFTSQSACIALLLALGGPAFCAAAESEGTTNPVMVTLSGVDYLHRWSHAYQHEFRPVGQEDLDHWSDMVTINYYPDVTDGEALAKAANTVLENYKSNGATIWGTDSVQGDDASTAKHLIVLSFTTSELIETAFACFSLIDGIGASVVFAHREVGSGMEERMDAWVKKHSEAAQDSLMALEEIPTLDEVGHGE